MLGPSVSLKMIEVRLVYLLFFIAKFNCLNMLCATHDREKKKQLESIFKISGDRKRYLDYMCKLSCVSKV